MNANETVEYWRKEIAICEKWMQPKRLVWRELLKLYRLEMEVPGYAQEDVVRVSRFYPLVRQLVAAIAFQYPAMFFTVKDPDYQYTAELLEQIANSALEVCNVRREMQQAIFDALHCSLGWLKFGYNPPGSNDIIAPYVMADDMENDFPYVRRVSPFNMLVDPLTAPHSLGTARWLIEKMLVPLEFVKKDDRFAHRDQVKPIRVTDTESVMFENMQTSPFNSSEEQSAYDEALESGEMVQLYEVHDRIHRRRLVIAEGVDAPLEDVDHPLLEMEPSVIIDPETQRPLLTGEFRPTGAYLVRHGFPYHAIKFDLSDESIHGQPMLEYVRDEQQGITESVTRRADLLKRFSRILLGQRSEREQNPDVEGEIKRAEDGSVLWVNDIDKAFRELQFAAVPQDQLGLEADLRQYEDQVLQVSQLALSGGSSRMTAMQASLIASFGQLNREWLQEAVAEAYRVTSYNLLRIMSDERYLPNSFLVSMGKRNGLEAYQAMTSDMLKVRFKIRIEANSMRPLFEQLEKEDTLALVQHLIQIPEIKRREVIQMLLRTFRVPNPDRFLGPELDMEATRAAQLENQFIASRMMDPGVLPTQDHDVHLAEHMKAQQDPQILQFIQGLVQTNPQAPQMIVQLFQQHVAQHQQFQQQIGKPGGGAPGGGKAIPSMRDAAGSRSQLETASGLQSQVRSNSQRMGQSVSINPNQG